MKCEICHSNDATTAYTHIVDDAKKTLLLCANCIPKSKGDAEAKPSKVPGEQDVPVLVKKVKVEFGTAPAPEASAVGNCDECGMTYQQFKKVGRLGCHRCYAVFGAQLERLLKRIHGADAHCGKGRIEKGAAPRPAEALDLLRSELSDAVKREDFERAAQIRDRIRTIEAESERPVGEAER